MEGPVRGLELSDAKRLIADLIRILAQRDKDRPIDSC